MKIAIMQPTYLPWMGYFALIQSVDAFVVLDNVQFEHQSWQHKNKINSKNGLVWLTVPVFTNGRFGQLINQVEIDNKTKWRKKHLESIRFSYIKAKYFNQIFPYLDEIYNNEWNSLVELNLCLIRFIMSQLKINTPLIIASDLESKGRQNQRVVNICKELKADTYLSPFGSVEYINENNIFMENRINLIYQNYIHPHYSQQDNFLPYLSIVDLLMHNASSGLSTIKSGIRNDYTHDQAHKMFIESKTSLD